MEVRIPSPPAGRPGDHSCFKGAEMRHFARRTVGGQIEVVDCEFDFVRAILPYDYRFTCNADQWDHAGRICAALEGPMASQGVITISN
jgi:hypothetical protein